MIKTIIFDIGNVLADFTWREFFDGFKLEPDLFNRLCEATVLSDDWKEVDRGVFSTEEIIKRFVDNDPALEETIFRVFENVRGMVSRNEYAIPWIQELKQKGYQVLVLSNFSEKVFKDCSDALDFLQYVDGGILSYREKVIKPEPAIYERLIEKYGLDPQQCVFLDDLEKNLDAAEAFGIHTICFQSKKQADSELYKLGVE